jgi:hypothetical protein
MVQPPPRRIRRITQDRLGHRIWRSRVAMVKIGQSREVR